MRLTEFFTGVAAKRLRPVEVNPSTSNQHEVNGINSFRRILGDAKRKFDAVFLYLDDENDPIRSPVEWATWYDARQDDPTRSAEYRLYYPTTEVSKRFAVGDQLIVAMCPDRSLLFIASPAHATISEQLLWLFGLESPDARPLIRDAGEIDRDIDYIVRIVLDSIGVDVPAPPADADLIRDTFGMVMPPTRDFSNFARLHATECEPKDDPDHALICWMETEERYFRAFERMLVESRLRQGFVSAESVDVDGFISFSLGVQNRRKSRAGFALENHVEHILKQWQVKFQRGVTTEGRSKPDFLFPGQREYNNPRFDTSKLSILGAKASCKDRWRQLLGEADRVETKHLLTLEPSISVNQTDEMKGRQVQLVLPSQVHATYNPDQRTWLWTLRQFLEHIRRQQD